MLKQRTVLVISSCSSKTSKYGNRSTEFVSFSSIIGPTQYALLKHSPSLNQLAAAIPVQFCQNESHFKHVKRKLVKGHHCLKMMINTMEMVEKLAV